MASHGFTWKFQNFGPKSVIVEVPLLSPILASMQASHAPGIYSFLLINFRIKKLVGTTDYFNIWGENKP